ncbi:MAG: Hpt domain-containing protein [Wenzhouxiangella sp.]
MSKLLDALMPARRGFEILAPDRLEDVAWIDSRRPGFKALVLEEFQAHFNQTLEELGGAVLANDQEQVRGLVHRLRGSAVSFGAQRLAVLLRDLHNRLEGAQTQLTERDMSRLRQAGAAAMMRYQLWLDQ